MSRLKNPPMFLPLLALLLATLFWGSSFITISTALKETNPFTLLTLRFGLASFFILFLLSKKVKTISKETWRAGAICGLLIYAGYFFNTAGLMTISSTMSGFLTALYVPFTPLFFWVIFGVQPERSAFVGVGLAFLGLIFLANPFTLTFENNPGEWYTILSAFLSALEIIIVGRYAPRCEAVSLAFTQVVSVFLFSSIGLLLATIFNLSLTETTWSWTVILSIVWLAIIVAFVQVLLSWAQRFISPHRAAVIFAMESVFAAIIGYIAGESIGIGGLFGGAMIVLGILVGEIPKLLTSKKG